jgi:signal transduction histidine kinase
VSRAWITGTPRVALRVGLVLVAGATGLVVGDDWRERLAPGAMPLAGPYAWWPIAHAFAGLSLLCAGAMAVVAGVAVRAGTLGVIAGVAWSGPVLALAASGWPVVRAAAVAVALLVLIVLARLMLDLVRGARPGRLSRANLIIDSAVIVVAVAVFLTYAPFFDSDCLRSCAYLGQLVDPGPSVRSSIRGAVQVAWVLAGARILLTSGIVLTASLRPMAVMVAAGGLLAGLGAWGAGVGRAGAAALAPDHAPWWVVPLALGGAVLALALAMRVVRLVATRHRIRSLAESMAGAPPPGTLEEALARALADPGLRVGYAADHSRFVGADGASLGIYHAGPDRVLTPVAREGAAIAGLVHRADLDRDLLVAELGPSVLVALDNERLRALGLARLAELRASRARIVEVADAERRRIERDLHDGAQQRLLAIAFDLRLARMIAERDGRHEAAAALGRSEALALACVEQLRRLCRSIHPQVLSQAGLGPALASLATESPIALEVRADLPTRPPLSVETAAYELVAECLTQSSRRGSAFLEVDAAISNGTLSVEASDGSDRPFELPQRLLDRLGAVGGRLLAAGDGEERRVRAVIPCA